jgi:DNA replication and repair protein RecF
VEVELSMGVNHFTGNNAQGKTNLLEAIFLLSTGRSFRTPHLVDLVMQGEKSFFIEAVFLKEGIEQTVSIASDGKLKRMKYNATTYPHFTNLLGLLPTVLIAPEDVDLISGAPADRRRFLDLHLAQIDPLYVHHLTRFSQAMRQRNFLLRHKKTDGIDAWESIMLASSAYIHAKRDDLLKQLQPFAEDEMLRLSTNKEHLTVKYLPSTISDYKASRNKELLIGTTLYGPHRDDISIFIDNSDARLFASQGQKRTAVAALRLAQWRHFLLVNGSAPILSFDDFENHLDEERRHRLVDEMSQLSQVFLTSPYPLDRQGLQGLAHFTVTQGQVILAGVH